MLFSHFLKLKKINKPVLNLAQLLHANFQTQKWYYESNSYRALTLDDVIDLLPNFGAVDLTFRFGH